MIVPRLQTPVPFAVLPGALDAAHRELRGESLSSDAYAIACAQLELEHGSATIGGELCLRGVFNDNLGNHDATAAERADPSVPIFDTVLEHEVGPTGKSFQAGHVREAYPDAVEGAKGYWTALTEHFASAYNAIAAGDPHAFVEALKAARYFTASEQSYEHAVDGMVAAWRARIAAEPAPDTDPTPATT